MSDCIKTGVGSRELPSGSSDENIINRQLHPDSRFPIPDSLLPIPDSQFPIPDSRLQPISD
ncbi:hypothetical protein [Moorena sp. SIO3I6]|uniref:hypothetical protein n=1 Tax=Moorena sp. SIO3I6 TaxID=2607831 RepID=UPI0013F7AFCE|nr:hypothetical protein [Moorena sp. SIO3I6]NEP29894.1 hypothetical protein [Moorena sp. SIO3I6]